MFFLHTASHRGDTKKLRLPIRRKFPWETIQRRALHVCDAWRLRYAPGRQMPGEPMYAWRVQSTKWVREWKRERKRERERERRLCIIAYTEFSSLVCRQSLRYQVRKAKDLGMVHSPALSSFVTPLLYYNRGTLHLLLLSSYPILSLIHYYLFFFAPATATAVPLNVTFAIYIQDIVLVTEIIGVECILHDSVTSCEALAMANLIEPSDNTESANRIN